MYYLNVLPLFLFFSLTLGSYPQYDLEKAHEYFADFIKKYERKYESAEEFRMRFEIFKKTLVQINEWNANSDYENSGFIITQFADLENVPPCFDPSQMNNTMPLTEVKREFIVNAPDEIDYTTQGLVTEVKDQNPCGSCYIFAAIGNIEGVHAKQNPGQLVSLSEQQILDCMSEATCHGGYSLNVINYVASSQGCMSEADYPYIEKTKTSCRFDAKKVKAKVNPAQTFNTPDDESLKGALSQNGAPLAVTVEATDSFTRWQGADVFTPKDCTGGGANHAVLLVGYGKDANGVSYWKFKNSWGTGVGDGGYYKLNMQNNCSFGRVATCSAT
ncbi:procathepsin L-like [Cydia pomonella]|uniref:procathepsin L-like n=1 Tax=Cydia pomonella TaxID=82600 RepID=UPI002ADDE751|nr:procathepsin L-like [Cydia pomonella]